MSIAPSPPPRLTDRRLRSLERELMRTRGQAESRPARPAGATPAAAAVRPAVAERLTAVVAVAAFLGAGGALLVATSSPSAGLAGRSPDAPVNPGATNAGDITANNSPSLAANPHRPGRLAVVNRIDQPNFSCALYISADDGGRWQPASLPFPTGEEAPPRCFAPDVAYGHEGTLYASFATLTGAGNTPHALWGARSVDDGASFGPPVRVAGPLAFGARLAAEPADTGLWLTWVQAQDVGNLLFPGTGYPIVASHSADGGRTWSAPVTVSSPSRARVVAPVPVFAAGGLDVLYLDHGNDVLDYNGAHEGRGGPPYGGEWSLVLARSEAGGAAWTETVVAPDVVPTERFVVFLPPRPALAVDGRHVYVAFQDGRLGDADVRLWASTDGGRHFGPGHRVNDTAEHDGTAQYLPQLAVAPDGRLDVLYYDRRSDPADVLNEASFQTSFDHGRTFTPRVALSRRSFDSRVGFGSFRGMPDLGSANALLSSDRSAVAIWTDTRAGALSGKQDLAVSTIRFRSAPALRAWGRPLAVGLAGVGLACLGTASRQRRRRRGWAARPAARIQGAV